jgi:hypothetical protein
MRRHDDQLIVRYGTGPYFSVRSHGSVSFEYRNSTEGGHFELSGPVRSCPVGP